MNRAFKPLINKSETIDRWERLPLKKESITIESSDVQPGHRTTFRIILGQTSVDAR